MKKEKERKTRSRRRTERARCVSPARKVNVFPAVNTRRAERRPGVGRLVTWSTVNDRESASRMRRYAADPDARNVIAARPFPSILGAPSRSPRGWPTSPRRHTARGTRRVAGAPVHAHSSPRASCEARAFLPRRPFFPWHINPFAIPEGVYKYTALEFMIGRC